MDCYPQIEIRAKMNLSKQNCKRRMQKQYTRQMLQPSSLQQSVHTPIMIMIQKSNATITIIFVLIASALLLRPDYCNAFIFTPKNEKVQLRRVSFLASTKQSNAATATKYDSTTEVSVDDQEWIVQGIESKQSTSINTDFLNHQGIIGPSRVLIYDTTLRDGTQGESVSASVDDKLKIVSRLSKFGVDYIEAGWPGSNPKDAEFFHRSKSELSQLEQSKLVAFGSTCRKHTKPHDDNQVDALINSNAPTICIVAKSHLWQVTDILQTTGDENLRMISDTVRYLTSDHNRTVMIDLEHFFDGYISNPEYALQCCENAVDAGVSCLVLCDTNGGTMPWDIATICASIVKHFDYHVTVGIHCHNDCGMAVANSLSAAQNGVGLIQGTINGIGERTGNADLCSIIPSLAFHLNKQQQSNENDTDDNNVETQQEMLSGSQMTCREHIADITSLSRYVDEILNRTPNAAAPYVGSSAFAHKGGLHVAAMERSSASYQHIDPAQVGNKKRVLVSELSGRQNILGKMKEHVDVFDNVDEAELSVRAMAILKHVKKLEAAGYTFEGADASVHLMILHSTRGYCPPFQVLDYTANVCDSNIDSATRVLYQQQKQQQTGGTTTNFDGNHAYAGAQARATVKVRTFTPPEYGLNQNVDEIPAYYTDVLEVSDGNGPVDALGKALKRALVPSYPYVQGIELIDYKVRILDPESATMAATRVMIEFRDTNTDNTWTTVSVDTNLISASLNALLDGFEYALIEHVESCSLCDDFFEEEKIQ